MTRHLRLVPSTPARLGDAEREARLFLQGRDQVTADQLAAHFSGRGWAMGPQRAGHLLVQLGWTGQWRAGGIRIFRRPSPIADGRWRRPWLMPAEIDPDLAASLERRSRWNRAFLIFVAAVAAYAIFLLLGEAAYRILLAARASL